MRQAVEPCMQKRTGTASTHWRTPLAAPRQIIVTGGSVGFLELSLGSFWIRLKYSGSLDFPKIGRQSAALGEGGAAETYDFGQLPTLLWVKPSATDTPENKRPGIVWSSVLVGTPWPFGSGEKRIEKDLGWNK
ncbi:hypothetical protein DFH06DRAFT_1295586 [Mycena polygramma]|nr:hypothetical protein DFH06DRAFT_1295586 [Mycena polygramma]